jgi:hypothetical protein
MSLIINKRDDAKAPTSFTLVEDTGLRCITTPCPSTTTSEFQIERISPSLRNDVTCFF